MIISYKRIYSKKAKYHHAHNEHTDFLVMNCKVSTLEKKNYFLHNYFFGLYTIFGDPITIFSLNENK